MNDDHTPRPPREIRSILMMASAGLVVQAQAYAQVEEPSPSLAAAGTDGRSPDPMDFSQSEPIRFGNNRKKQTAENKRARARIAKASRRTNRGRK